MYSRYPGVPNSSWQHDFQNQPSNMQMHGMQQNGNFQAPIILSGREPLSAIDNTVRPPDYRLQTLDYGPSSFHGNVQFDQLNDTNQKGNTVVQHPSRPMPLTIIAPVGVPEQGTVFSLMLSENNMDNLNDYDKNNEIYQILADTYEGSLQLTAYKVDKEAGLLSCDEAADENTQDKIDPNESLPAICFDDLFPEQGRDEKGKRLKRHFNVNKVAKLIVSKEYNTTRRRIPAGRLAKLAEAAASLFPQVGPAVLWYQAAVTVNGHSHSAKGKLNRQSHDLSNFAYSLGYYRNLEETNGFEEYESSSTFDELKFVEEVDESLKQKWLSIQLEVEAYFMQTTVEEIYKAFPFLKTDAGLELLLNHFDNKYSNLKDAFINNWQKETLLILQKALQLSKIDSATVKSLPDLGGQMALALIIMPSLMKPVVCGRSKIGTSKNSRSRRRKSTPAVEIDNATNEVDTSSWTATGEEACDSFVKHIEIKNDGRLSNQQFEEQEKEKINEHRKMLLEQYSSLKLPLTGHVVVIGPLADIKRSILFIDDMSFQFTGVNSTVRATEACFKVVTLLGKDFPKAASAAWEYIKCSVLSMPVPGILQSTTEFRSFLRTKKTPTPRPRAKATTTRKRKADGEDQ